jgi:hypothetical protein
MLPFPLDVKGINKLRKTLAKAATVFLKSLKGKEALKPDMASIGAFRNCHEITVAI